MTTSPERAHVTAGAAGGAGSWRAAGRRSGAAAPALGRELAAAGREFGSKLVAYYLVRWRRQRRATRGGHDLAALVVETYRRDPKHTAFLLERLCYDFVTGRWRAGEEPRRLLDGEAARSLPEESLILLHAGLGMALTEILLGPLDPASPAAAFDAALDRFAGLLEVNARPEYAAVACESLGLIVRRFLPRLHRPVEARLRARDAGLAARYWHGAGRAIYFLPSYFLPLPGMGRRGLQVCRREPRQASHRLDAIAGFAFASTMINLRRPELVAGLLRHLEPGETEALASGVAGALLTRHHTCPDAPEVRAFLRPVAVPWAGTDGRSPAEIWDIAVREPCAEALDRAYPLLRARGELAMLARHQPLGTLLGPERGERGE
jgi:hypothetical protein